MEDSYTVHRRRKAAARKREKTPERPKLREDDVAATDEEAETRARMETLVRETERLEELEDTERRRVEIEKPGDYAISNAAEKSQRALKRAVSPEVRRDDEESRREDGRMDSNRPSSSVVTSCDKTNSENREIIVASKETSGYHGQAGVEDGSKDHTGDPATKSKDNDGNVTSPSAVRRRRDVEKDSGKIVREKTTRSLKKAMSPDVERVEKKVTTSEWIGDVAGSEDRVRKTSSRAGNAETDGKQATALDENRYEAGVGTRQYDGGPVGLVRTSRDESIGYQDVKRNENEGERSSKQVDDSGRVKKSESTGTSSSKTRNLENRAGATTTTTAKRFGKERNVEKTGYTTDSSETEETAKRSLLRRKKSPEEAKTRTIASRKATSRSRAATTDTDGDVDESERRKRVEKRSTSRRRPSSDTDEDFRLKQRTGSPAESGSERQDGPRAPSRHGDKSRSVEKRSTGRHKPLDDTDEDLRSVRKSGTFPVDPSRDGSSKVPRSNSEMKKQIIPLSDDSLIEDFARAQMEYRKKERGILDNDPLDDYVDPKMAAALRRRKISVVRTDSEAGDVAQPVDQPKKRSWFGWLPFFGRKTEKKKEEDEDATKEEAPEEEPLEEIKEETTKVVEDDISSPKKVTIFEFFRTLINFVTEFRAFVEQNPRETRKIRVLRNRCAAELLLAIIYCGLGAFVFRFTEGAFETFYKCGVKRVKRDFLDSLWNFSHNLREEDWKSMARRKLMEFEEQLHTAHEAGVQSYSGQKSWSFLNAVVYCLTVITTIGYGHISPSTTTGRAITIVYAIFGIPMFLIILADFGKLFTRGIKFLWAFVRRVYYTGSCRRVRRTGPVQEVMKGVQLVYDLATFRRPSQMNPEEFEEMQRQQQQAQTMLNLDGNATPSVHAPDTPGTPAMSTFAIDDEFNLPISVAIVILLVYIFVGATVYNFWEEWGFFESFYFVFISMSTIGFGDYVPKHPIYMMLSIVYLVFGLALTSMCINVVQEMLSDSFKQASQKISATIGFEVAEEDEIVEATMQPPVEIADVHATIKESPSKEQMAPKAKQEDIDV